MLSLKDKVEEIKETINEKYMSISKCYEKIAKKPEMEKQMLKTIENNLKVIEELKVKKSLVEDRNKKIQKIIGWVYENFKCKKEERKVEIIKSKNFFL
jgi:hypothetical protein